MDEVRTANFKPDQYKNSFLQVIVLVMKFFSFLIFCVIALLACVRGNKTKDQNGDTTFLEYAKEDLFCFSGIPLKEAEILDFKRDELKQVCDDINSKAQKLKDGISQRVDLLLVNDTTEDLVLHLEEIINRIEPGLRQIIDEANLFLNGGTLVLFTQRFLLKNERDIYSSLKKEIQDESFKELDNSVVDLGLVVEERPIEKYANDQDKNILDSFYDERIKQPVYDHLREKYDRRELGLLEDEELSHTVEEPYEFQSSEGEFLDKNRELYEQLWRANPYNEQAVLARECSLRALELADGEFSNGKPTRAEWAYKIGLALEDIVSGQLPMDIKRQIYELCTDKDLFIGEAVEDRSSLVSSLSFLSFLDQELSEEDVKTLALILDQLNEKISERGEGIDLEQGSRKDKD